MAALSGCLCLRGVILSHNDSGNRTLFDLTCAIADKKDLTMKHLITALCATTLALPAAAQVARELDAHEHGVTTLQLAVQGNMLEVHLTAPGADVVGFEYEAATDADREAIDNAISLLSDPKNVLHLPTNAKCELQDSDAHLEGDDHEEHEHEHEHEHEEDHAKASQHTEFVAHYGFSCAEPANLTSVSFPYFQTFENAQEVHITFLTDQSAGTAEATRDASEISLK